MIERTQSDRYLYIFVLTLIVLELKQNVLLKEKLFILFEALIIP